MNFEPQYLSPEMLEYRDSPDATSAIAARHGISPSTLTVRARKAGLALRERGRWKRTEPTAVQKRIIAMAKKRGCQHTALHFGISKQRVSFIKRRWKDWPNRTSKPHSTDAHVITVPITASLLTQLNRVLQHPWFCHLYSPEEAAREILQAFLSGNLASLKVTAQDAKRHNDIR